MTPGDADGGRDKAPRSTNVPSIPWLLRSRWSLFASLATASGVLAIVFTYLVSTKDSLGMAKDTMAAKPMVLYESDDLVALASEEVAIRAVIPHEIDTWDPYDEEVRVWRA